MSLLIPKEGDVNRLTTQIEVRENKKFEDVNQNNVNLGYVNRKITVQLITLNSKSSL